MDNFKVTINNIDYVITPEKKTGVLTYKVETGCDYMFSIHANENEEWQVKENDVKPFDNDLINAIGNAIDLHYDEQ